MCSEDKAKAELIAAYFPNVTFTPEERDGLGTILLAISTRETQLKMLGADLRTVAETIRYAARNCCRNPKQREAIERIMAYAKIAE